MKYARLINLGLNKRQKIVLASILITFGLASTQTINLFYRKNFIIGLSVLTILVSFWALWEGMSRVKAFTLLVLPSLFTLGSASFYFLLPVRWLTRVPVATLFGLSFYFLLLSQNVFNVAAIRTIPLYRAASTVTFLFTIITAMLLFHDLHVLKLSFIENGVAVAVLSLLLTLPILWSVEMEKISSKILTFSLIISTLMGEMAASLSFWPIPFNSLMWSITLASFLFILLGACMDVLRERLTKKEVWLYSGFGLLVLTVTFLTTSWTG